MNTFVIALVLLAGTNVLGQNPYEYVDDALIQKVGQIVYEYDQQVAASRAAGGSNGVIGRSVNEVSGGYQMRQPERVSRANTFNNYNSNANRVNYTPQQQRVNYVPQQEQRMINYVPQQQEAIVIPAYRSQQQQYNQVQQQTYVQPQQVYQSNRNQRQFVAAPVTSTYQAPAPVARTYQAPAPVARTYQAPAPVARTYQTPAPVARTYQAPAPVARTYQAPAPVARTYQAPAPVARSYQTPVARMGRMYQEPQVVQQQQPMKKSGFSAYTLSQPEAIPMVAEFHFTEALNARADNTGSYNNANAGSLKTDVNHNNQVQMENNKFRLA